MTTYILSGASENTTKVSKSIYIYIYIIATINVRTFRMRDKIYEMVSIFNNYKLNILEQYQYNIPFTKQIIVTVDY